MPRLEIIPAQQTHCAEIAQSMRREQETALLTCGFDPLTEIMRAFEESLEPKAAFINGSLAAVFGVASPSLSPVGALWFILTEHAMRCPLAVVKEARRQIDIAHRRYPQLITTLPPGDGRARAFAERLGFRIIPGHFVRGAPLARRVVANTEAAG
jgi:hypothetical protein